MSDLDMTKLEEKDFEDLIGVVKWAVIFSNHVHSPDCKDDELCGVEPDGRKTVCSHVGFHRELKAKYNIVAEKIGAAVAQ